MKLKSLSAAITFAIASFAAHASDENIVVVGSALDQLVQTEINSETLEQKQASDIKDILNTMPSVTVDGNARYSRKVTFAVWKTNTRLSPLMVHAKKVSYSTTLVTRRLTQPCLNLLKSP